jgi:hypothetical protein
MVLNFLREFFIIVDIWASSSTFHGMPKIFLNTKLQRTIWLFFFVLSMLGCIVFVRLTFVKYYEYGVTTKVEDIKVNSMELPAITICNRNAFVNNKSVHFANNIDKKVNEIGGSIGLFTFYASNKLYDLPLDERASMSLTRDELIFDCQILLSSCEKRLFKSFYIGNYGNCYSFNMNSEDRITTERSGLIYGVTFNIFVGFSNEFIEAKGAHIFIHEPGIFPTYSSGIDLEVKKSTSLAIKKTISNKLSYPYNNCTDSKTYAESYNEFYKVFLDYNITYNQEACINLCLQELFIKNCSCYDFTGTPGNLTYLPTYPNSSKCVTFEEFSCLANIYINYSNIYAPLCTEKCRPSCDEVFYSLKISKANYPTKEYLKEFLMTNQLKYDNKTLTFDEVFENILQVHVYFDELSYRQIEQIAIFERVQILSGIGSTISLFLGASFISLVEILDLFIRVIKCTISK